MPSASRTTRPTRGPGWSRRCASWTRSRRCPPRPARPPRTPRSRPAREREHYLDDIADCQREIAAGESYEICLTNELRSGARVDPLPLYRELRRRNPAPYAAYLRFGDMSILSSSPERFLRIDRDGWIEAKPIKGTAPRGATAAEDRRLRTALRDEREDARREPDDRRSAAQRPRQRERAGQRLGAEADARRDVPDAAPAGLHDPRPPPRRRLARRVHPRRLPGGLDDRRAEAAHDGHHRPARGPPARCLLGRDRVPGAQRHDRPQRRHPHAGGR